jgi:hypothetical protein
MAGAVPPAGCPRMNSFSIFHFRMISNKMLTIIYEIVIHPPSQGKRPDIGRTPGFLLDTSLIFR